MAFRGFIAKLKPPSENLTTQSHLAATGNSPLFPPSNPGSTSSQAEHDELAFLISRINEGRPIFRTPAGHASAIREREINAHFSRFEIPPLPVRLQSQTLMLQMPLLIIDDGDDDDDSSSADGSYMSAGTDVDVDFDFDTHVSQNTISRVLPRPPTLRLRMGHEAPPLGRGRVLEMCSSDSGSSLLGPSDVSSNDGYLEFSEDM